MHQVDAWHLLRLLDLDRLPVRSRCAHRVGKALDKTTLVLVLDQGRALEGVHSRRCNLRASRPAIRSQEMRARVSRPFRLPDGIRCRRRCDPIVHHGRDSLAACRKMDRHSNNSSRMVHQRERHYSPPLGNDG